MYKTEHIREILTNYTKFVNLTFFCPCLPNEHIFGHFNQGGVHTEDRCHGEPSFGGIKYNHINIWRNYTKFVNLPTFHPFLPIVGHLNQTSVCTRESCHDVPIIWCH